jgi:mannose-6-phosphate isomerase-like protein (cupin superfamily)
MTLDPKSPAQASAKDWLLKLAEGMNRLPPATAEQFIDLFEHGTMKVGLYAPRETDPQTPHARDELYIVQCGSGTFSRGDEKRPFGPGDVIFVPAGMDHRFENFTDDFAAWVFFWGPDGGESRQGR